MQSPLPTAKVKICVKYIILYKYTIKTRILIHLQYKIPLDKIMGVFYNKIEKIIRSTNMIIDQVRKLLAEQFGVEEYELNDNADIMGDYCSTPMEKVDVAMAIEDTFGITVSDEEFSCLSSLEEIADYVERNL